MANELWSGIVGLEWEGREVLGDKKMGRVGEEKIRRNLR